MVSEIKLEFPKFITHIPVSKNKAIKIGYNQLYASPHYTVRSALVSAMHGYIENNIPDNLNIKSPLETHLIIYAPINYGDVKTQVNIKLIGNHREMIILLVGT